MIRSLCVALLSTFGVVSTSPFAQTTTVILPATKDNTLHDESLGTTSNGIGPAFFAGRINAGFIRRAVLAFDIANQLPPNAVVNSASLQLRMNRTVAGIAPMNLHRVLSDWGEGTSESEFGLGAPSTPNDATWLHTFYPSSFWSTPGGDYFPASTAQTLVNDVGFYTWSSPYMAGDVQNWLDNPSIDFGWILIGYELTFPTVKKFVSREGQVAANRPALTVNYSTPPTCDVTPAGTQMITAGLPLSFSVSASDMDPGDVVTLSATGLPAGATLTPALPLVGATPATVFDWTPTSAVQGSYVVNFEVEDSTGLKTICPVTIEVAECFLVMGPGPGSATFSGGGYTWETQLSRVDYYYPITLDSFPAFGLPYPAVSRNKLRKIRTPLEGFSAQVLMWNPEFFPTNPAQWSRVLSVTPWSDGTVTTNQGGSFNGMGIDDEVFVQQGRKMIRFPFTIEGF